MTRDAVLARFRRLPERAFSLSVVLLAVLLPLEIVPNAAISVLSGGVTLLLIPYACMNWRRLLNARLGLAFAAVLAAAWAPLALGFDSPLSASLRTFTVLILRTWATACLVESRHVALFESATLATSAVVVIFGFYQYVGDIVGLPESVTYLKNTYSASGTYAFPRVHSFAREPLLLANYLFIPLALLAVRLLHKGSLRAYETLLLVGTMGLVLTLNSRGAFVALLVLTLIVVSFSHKARKLLRRYTKWLLISAFISVSLIGIAVRFDLGSLGSYFRHALEYNDPSFVNRLEVWTKTTDVLIQSPITGVGIGNSSAALSGTAHKLPDGPVFNNTYLTFITEMGLIGILAAIPIIWLFIKLLTGSMRISFSHPSAAYGMIIISYSIQAATFEGLLNLRVWAVVGISLAAWRLYGEPSRKEKIFIKV